MSEISFFDLPPLYRKPSANTLLKAIDALRIDSQAFSGPLVASNDLASRDAIRYLTAVISSPLSWLPDGDAQEVVWTAASQGLNERAGRSAQPSRTRTLTISSDSTLPHVDIELHEPTLTSDHLGHKTWVAGYLLAKRLVHLSKDVPALLPQAPSTVLSDDSKTPARPLILELGAGTGLVGLALAHRVPDAELHLTDLPSIIPNLAANVERNFPRDAAATTNAAGETLTGRKIHVFTLDWHDYAATSRIDSASTLTSDQPLAAPHCERMQCAVTSACASAYDLVVAADVLYSAEHPGLVAGVAAHFLRRNAHARIVVEVPVRERMKDFVDALRMEMGCRGQVLASHGEEDGWEEMGREEGRVQCWWGVWKWKAEKLVVDDSGGQDVSDVNGGM